MLSCLTQRELCGRPPSFNLTNSIDVTFNRFQRTNNCGVEWIDLDPVEQRYLLSGCTNGDVRIHDLHKRPSEQEHKAVLQIDRETPGHHTSAVACVQWYPHDTGMFVSLAPHRMCVWDSNQAQADLRKMGCRNKISATMNRCIRSHIFAVCEMAFEFSFSQPVMNFDISRQALVAVSCADHSVYLCDLKNGSKSHIIKGHSSGVAMVKWSPRNTNILVSSGMDGKVLAHDVRKSKSMLMSFDDSSTGDGAHKSLVNGLVFAREGLQLMTYSTDNSLKLWEFSLAELHLTKYIQNNSKTPLKLSLSNHVLFAPSHSNVEMVDLSSEEQKDALSAHFLKTTSVEVNEGSQTVYTASIDTQILEWFKQILTEVEISDNWDE